jgi:hypothetical protein
MAANVSEPDLTTIDPALGFSLAIADTFWLGLLTTLLALAVVAFGLREVQLRGSAPRGVQATSAGAGAAPAGAIERERSAADTPIDFSEVAAM